MTDILVPVGKSFVPFLHYFSSDQLQELRKVNLASILCENLDGVYMVQVKNKKLSFNKKWIKISSSRMSSLGWTHTSTRLLPVMCFQG